MKALNKYSAIALAILVIAFLVDSISPNKSQKSATQKTSPSVQIDSASANLKWVTAYLVSWNHYAAPGGAWGNLPTEAIDWSAFTHMIYFAFGARADGSISPEIKQYNNMNPDRLNAITSSAHAHHVPVLFAIGGWGNYDGFSKAITPAVRPVFIRNLISLMNQWHFDGIDIDMEPIKDSDLSNYTDFIKELRSDLNKLNVPASDTPILTAAVGWQPQLFAQLQDQFDQINVMAYDMSGAWGRGWVTWFNTPLYNTDRTFWGSDKLLPSVDERVKRFINAGINTQKLGLGIDFYGYVWNGGSGTTTGGVTAPQQHWSEAPKVQSNVPYFDIMDKYYKPDRYHWDSEADVPYLGINENGDSNDKFISYDDEKSIEKKVEYAKKYHMGGVFIYDISAGYRKDAAPGSRDKLLQAVKESVK